MPAAHAVRRMTGDDLAAVQAIGLAAGERFRADPDPRIAERADDPPMAAADVAPAVESGSAWVAVDEDGAVVGFLVAEELDGCAHVEELAVAPEAAGRGHGAALLDAVAAWATRQRLAAVTLTTFRDVAFNRPYYERRGFRVLTDDELTPGLAARRRHEDGAGLAAELRVAMRLELGDRQTGINARSGG